MARTTYNTVAFVSLRLLRSSVSNARSVALGRTESELRLVDKVWGEELDKNFKQAIIDRYNGWELVELLDIRVEDIVEEFEDVILDYEEELREEMGYVDKENNNDDE